MAYCPNRDYSCEWQGPPAKVAEHLAKSCETIPCVNKSKGCKSLLQSSGVQEHQAKCDFGTGQCSLCGSVVQRRMLAEHEANTCPANKAKAPPKPVDPTPVTAAPVAAAPAAPPSSGWTKPPPKPVAAAPVAPGVLSTRKVVQEVRLAPADALKLLNPRSKDIERFSVGGRLFELPRAVIDAHPSLLTVLVSRKHQTHHDVTMDDSGALILLVDAKSFEHIVAWLTTGYVPAGLPHNEHGLLVATAKTLQLDEFVAAVTEQFANRVPMTQQDLNAQMTFRAILSKLNTHFNVSGCNLTGMQFAGLSLTRWQFHDAILDNCYFRSTNLESAQFQNASLRGAHIIDCFVGNATFQNADLTGATLERVNWMISGPSAGAPSFERAVMVRVKFVGPPHGAGTPTLFTQADMTDATVLPDALHAHATSTARVPPKPRE